MRQLRSAWPLAALAPLFASSVALAADAPRKPSLALLEVVSTGPAGSADAAAIEGLLLVGLEAGGRIQVTGRRDISTLLGFEQEKQLLGCDSSSCVTELAGALGVDYVAAADVGPLGDVLVLNVKVLDARKGVSVARASRQVASSSELPMAVDGITREIVAVLLGETIQTVRTVSWIAGGVVSVAFVVVGAVLGSQSRALMSGDSPGTEGGLTTHTITERAAAQAAGLATGANICFGLGGLAAVGTGIGFFVTLPSGDSGGGAGFAGSF